VETIRYYQEYLYLFRNGTSSQPDVTEAEMFAFFDCDITDGTYNSRQTEGLLDEIGAGLLSVLRTNNGTLKISHTSVSAFHGQ